MFQAEDYAMSASEYEASPNADSADEDKGEQETVDRVGKGLAEVNNYIFLF